MYILLQCFKGQNIIVTIKIFKMYNYIDSQAKSNKLIFHVAASFIFILI